MKQIIRKTFGGLSAEYYLRQFLFAAAFAGVLCYVMLQGTQPIAFGTVAFLLINTFLYPYSRFVYERIASFILGNNLFVLNALLMLLLKLLTIALCWCLAIFIAPLGLAYLYYHHSKASVQG